MVFGGLYEEVSLVNFEVMTNFKTCHNAISLRAGAKLERVWGRVTPPRKKILDIPGNQSDWQRNCFHDFAN